MLRLTLDIGRHGLKLALLAARPVTGALLDAAFGEAEPLDYSPELLRPTTPPPGRRCRDEMVSSSPTERARYRCHE